MAFQSVCVFCGSKTGADPAYAAAARSLGALLASEHLTLVYGGASVGLMGAVADATLAGGGQVIGVIPHGLASKEIAHPGLTTLHRVGTMHERKALMEQLSGAFIAMPGGFGTLDEMMEILTWTQLGLHRKPAGFLDVKGYWQPLLRQLKVALAEGFIPQVLERAVVSATEPDQLLALLRTQELPPAQVKWLTSEEL